MSEDPFFPPPPPRGDGYRDLARPEVIADIPKQVARPVVVATRWKPPAASSSTVASHLPESLVDVDPSAAIEERLDSVPLAAAVLGGSVLFHGIVESGSAAAGGAVLCAGIGWALLRRRRRVTLCVAGKGVGVYRRGRLASIVLAEDLAVFRLSIVRTMRIVSLFLFALAVVGIASFAMTWSRSGREVATVLPILGAAVAGVLAMGSVAWGRIVCRTLVVPGVGLCTVRRADLDRHPVLAALR
ncbi:MAG TPA: hypothetical protein VM925_16290 [Labilithrix sp.]|jgi:hypothetical protein|nr:hypothetical protein [Labilithrix sp.]